MTLHLLPLQNRALVSETPREVSSSKEEPRAQFRTCFPKIISLIWLNLRIFLLMANLRAISRIDYPLKCLILWTNLQAHFKSKNLSRGHIRQLLLNQVQLATQESNVINKSLRNSWASTETLNLMLMPRRFLITPTHSTIFKSSVREAPQMALTSLIISLSLSWFLLKLPSKVKSKRMTREENSSKIFTFSKVWWMGTLALRISRYPLKACLTQRKI